MRDSVIHMNPEARNDHGAAVAVKTGIVDESEQRGEIEAPLYVGRAKPGFAVSG
jgi:hypothetical protein